MYRFALGALLLMATSALAAQDAPLPSSRVPPPAMKANAMPAMDFFSTVASDDLLAAFKENPAFASAAKGLDACPFHIVATHGIHPTAGGTAAGLVSAILSGSTLGLLPVVTANRMFIRYDVVVNGRVVASQLFENTETRADSIWVPASGGNSGFTRGGIEWAKSTARIAADRFAHDPQLAMLWDEARFYFPGAGNAPVPPAPPAPPAPPESPG